MHFDIQLILFGLSGLLTNVVLYKLLRLSYALETSNNFLLELKALLELENLEVQMCFQLLIPINNYMDAYRKGLNAKQTEYAVKKYKHHHIIPQSIFQY